MMMVMIVLSLLLILAVTFTYLMSQQEGASVAALELEKTRITTRTGTDHAWAQLGYRNRLNEYARWYAMPPNEVVDWHNPDVDVWQEHLVDLRQDFEGDDRLFIGAQGPDGPLYPVSDPRRFVQGLSIADESGKLNLNFSSVTAFANMLGAGLIADERVASEGGVYPQVTLTDASFLAALDGGNTGGYVVIDNYLFKYASRRGDVLFQLTPNPLYNGIGNNAIFAWWSPARSLGRGQFVTTPTAYKPMLHRLLRANTLTGTPAWFNHVADLREVASLPRLFVPEPALGPTVMGERLDGWPEGIDPVAMQIFEENATTLAPTLRFDGGWFYPSVVLGGGMVDVGESGKQALLVRYESDQAFQPDYYVAGDPRVSAPGYDGDNLVRLRSSTGRIILGWALGGGAGSVVLVVEGEHEIDASEGWIIEIAERAPVNINTANHETLVALFHGVGPRGRDGPGPIDMASARRIADEIMAFRFGPDDENGPPAFRSLNDLRLFLDELKDRENPPIFAEQIGVFIRQQALPYSPGGGRATMPISFSSMDAYMVDAYATSYQPAGGTRARNAIREWALVGSDRPQTLHWHLSSQLRDEMRHPQGNILQLHFAGTENRRGVGLLELPYVHYPQERRVRQRGEPAWSSPEAWSPWQRGVDTGQRRERFYVANTVGQAPGGYEAGDLDAGSFQMWFRRKWQDLNTNHYLCDVAEREYSNRLSLLWWGERRGAYNLQPPNRALVLRVKDRTLEEAFTELRYDLDDATFRHDEWYHLGVHWKGTRLGHLALTIDGDCSAGTGSPGVKPQMHHTFRQPNGAWVSRTSTLAQDLEDPKSRQLSQTDIPIDIRDIDAFPDRGVVVIGDEAIEYDGKLGASLIIRHHEGVCVGRGPPNPAVAGSAVGARGTVASFHPRGSKVTVFGYTAPLRAWFQNWPQPATELESPSWPHLPRTSGNLVAPLPARAFWRVGGTGSANSAYYRAEELGPDAGFPGGGDDLRGANPNLLPLADYNGLPPNGVLFLYGPAFIGYRDRDGVLIPNFSGVGSPPYTGLPMQRGEYIAYDAITPQGLRVVARYTIDTDPDSPTFRRLIRKDPATYFHYVGSYPPLGSNNELFSAPPDPGNADPLIQAAYQQLLNRINFYSHGSVAVLVSIPVDNAQGYHPRSVVQVNDEWLRYNMVWNPAEGTDVSGETPEMADDNLFPALIFWDHEYLLPDAQETNPQPTPQGTVRWIINASNAMMLNPPLWAPWRGACGTVAAPHGAASRVTPTFGTTVTSGNADVITLIDGRNNRKELHQIRQQRWLHDYWDELQLYNVRLVSTDPDQYQAEPITDPNPVTGQYICALHDHVSADYFPNPQPGNALVPANPFPQSGTNLCKFPTGELPVQLPTTWTFAGADPRTQDGTDVTLEHSGDFDSFELRAWGSGDFRLLDDAVNAGAPGEGGEIIVNAAPTQGFGVVKIDDELIAYRSVAARQVTRWHPANRTYYNVQGYALRDISRGVLGSPIQAHAPGSYIMNMAGLRIGRATGAGGPAENNISAEMGEDGFRPYGFLRFDQQAGTELIGYQKYRETSTADPSNSNSTIRIGTVTAGQYRGQWPYALFRGAYGTQPRTWDNRTLFFDQPVRFPDWFAGFCLDGDAAYESGVGTASRAIPGAVSPEITHFQGAATLRNGVFTGFRWRIAWEPHADPARHADALGARLVVRFKKPGVPLPEWDSQPTNAPGGLYAWDFEVGGSRTEHLGSTLYEQSQDFVDPRLAPFGVRADRIEWRVYPYFKTGAFANEDYKATLQFRGAEVDVRQVTRIVRHEERR